MSNWLSSSPTTAAMDARTAVASVDSGCYHCGLSIPDDANFTLEIDHQQRHFCCPGCQAVAGLIHQGGFEQFYRYRSELNQKPDELAIDFALYDRDEIQQSFVNDSGTTKIANLLVDGITCAACVWLIEKYLGRIDGVINVSVNAVTHQCRLEWDPQQQPLSVLMQQLAAIGYRPQPFTQADQQQQQQRQQRRLLARLGVAGFGMMQVSMVAVALYAGDIQGIDSQWVQLFRWVSLLVATPVVLFSAQPFWSAAWRSLKQRHLTMDVPVSIAIVLAYIASAWATIAQTGEVYFDSISMFTFFLLLGRYLEMRLRFRNQQRMGAMSQLLPITVTRVIAGNASQDDSGKGNADKNTDNDVEVIALTELAVGDRVRVFSGDTVPCDGVVLEGESAVIEAVLTGEAEPVNKLPGDALIAGTVNTDGSLLMQVTATGEQTRLSTISQLVQQAEQNKPAIHYLADKVASYFVAAVLIVSCVVFFGWRMVEPEAALWITLSVLVVTCPCALSLATPTALTAAVATMRQQGVLVLKGHVTETLTAINKVIFDKTGTLTHGQPRVTDVQLVDTTPDRDPVSARENVLAIAAALEQQSNHPIASAFDDYRDQRDASQLTLVTGAGVGGVIEGVNYRLGKPGYALEKQHNLPELPGAGQWLLLSKKIAENWQVVAWIGLADQLRDSAVETIRQFRQQSIAVEILSGDNPQAVAPIAETLGVSFLAEQTPEQKLAYVEQQQQRHTLMMVGDGINDVPVLAGADISVAMDSASDFARTRADSVLLQGDLTRLPQMVTTARKGKSIIRQNLGWALGYNILALPLAALGFIPPYLAAIGMSASSLIVVLNALRLYRG